MVYRRGVLGFVVDGALVVFWEKLLDFPVVLLDAHGEFQIFAGDGVPVLFLDVSGTIQIYQAHRNHTLYTIITPSRLQMVAKKSPSR
jgi:uncharacterized protein (AIM24 family)